MPFWAIRGPWYNSAPGFIINIPFTSLMLDIGHKCLANQVVCLEVAHGFRAKISWFSTVPDFDPNVSSALRSKCTSDRSPLFRWAVHAPAHSQVCFESWAEQTGFWAKLSQGLRRNLLPILVCVIVYYFWLPSERNAWFPSERHQNSLHHPRLSLAPFTQVLL